MVKKRVTKPKDPCAVPKPKRIPRRWKKQPPGDPPLDRYGNVLAVRQVVVVPVCKSVGIVTGQRDDVVRLLTTTGQIMHAHSSDVVVVPEHVFADDAVDISEVLRIQDFLKGGYL